MKAINFIIFFSIFLSIYGAVNYYIFIRGWQSLPREAAIRIPYLVLFLIVSLSYIGARVLERATVCVASEIFIWIGSFWFGFMLYLFLGALLWDIARLGNWIAGAVPPESALYGRIRAGAALSTVAVATLIVITGYINTLNPHIRNIVIDIPKRANGRACLDIALATEIHLGTIISNSRVQRMIDMINAIRPDVVLLGGHIVDEDLKPVIEHNTGDLLDTIRSRYGTFAVTGNHEYIGGVNAACGYLAKHGVTFLRDEARLIDGSFYLVGREDRSIGQFSGKRRLPLEAIIDKLDRKLPLIMMDHQPIHLSDAADNGIDLQLSGHTHHGQLWPASIVTRMIYEVSYGFKKIGGTNVYVSGGYGTWGPPARVGIRPEIVHIKLRFIK